MTDPTQPLSPDGGEAEDQERVEPMRGKYCPECKRAVDSLDPTHAPGCPNGPPWDGQK